jgi:hypothetical protein
MNTTPIGQVRLDLLLRAIRNKVTQYEYGAL